MSREKSIPEKRFARIMIKTANQRKHALSGFERKVGRKINYWQRGLYFTWVWEDLGREWHWYEDEFLEDRQWWLHYEPFFWRSGEEFFTFEARFVEEATRKNPIMTQAQFARQGRALKRELQLGAIQGPLLAAVATSAGAFGLAAKAMDKMGDVQNAVDMAKCWVDEGTYEQECASVVAGWITKGAKMHISE